MTIFKLEDQHQKEYEDFVAAQHSGSFLQSWGWGNFQTQLGKSVIRYGIFDNNKASEKHLVATVQFLKTKVPHLPGYYLYAPYGPVIESDNKKIILDKLVSQIKSDFPDCWFIRFEPKEDCNLEGSTTIRIQPGKTLVTTLDKTLEEILTKMHQKTRYNIKVADKHGVAVESEMNVLPQHGFHISEFINLLTQTSNRQKFKSYEKNYYQKMIDFFILHSRTTDCQVSLYKALHGKNLVAAAIMIDHGQTRTYLFGGSDEKYRNLMAPYALHWQSMQDAKTAGLTNYDWWGIETATGKTPGFVQFKLKWGGKQISYPSAVDIVNKNGWYIIYKILRKINRLV